MSGVEVIAKFTDTVGELAAATADFGPDEVRTGLPRLITDLQRAQAVMMDMMRIAQARGGCGPGYHDTTDWIAEATPLDRKETAGWWCLSEHLDTHPPLAAAFAAGLVGPAHASILAEFLDQHAQVMTERLRPPERENLITEVINQAWHPDSRHLRAVLRRYADHLAALMPADDTEPPPPAVPEAEDRGRNRLRIRQLRNGRFTCSGNLDSLTGDALATALSALNDPIRLPDGRPDPRDIEQRNADALETIVRHFLDSGDAPIDGGDRPHLSLHLRPEDLADDSTDQTTIDFGSLIRDGQRRTAMGLTLDEVYPQGQAWTSRIGSLTIRSARRLACDACVSGIVMNEQGCPIDIGAATQRHPNRAQRRALEARDKGCAFPNCTRPAQYCVSHHIVHWANKGPTILANLVLLCHHHHHAVHHEGWGVEITSYGFPQFFSPGTFSGQRKPIPANHRHHIVIDGQLIDRSHPTTPTDKPLSRSG